MKTKVFPRSFKGNPMFTVFEIDENGKQLKSFDSKTGEPRESKSLLNMGLKKAQLCIKHIEDLKTFVSENN